MQQAYALVIFFLVGFITSFFIKNMIVILLFATFVSLFFQSTQYKIAGRETFENQEEGVEEKEGGDATPAPVKESLSDETSNEEEVDLTNAQVDSEAPTVTKAAKLKKDMKDYFAVQEKLLDVLEKAEPLQKEAMAIKERFNEKAKKTK
jgi:hypothetical protein